MNLIIKKKYFLVALGLCAIINSYSQIVTSISNGSWTDPSVWDGGQVPVLANSTEIRVNHDIDIVGPASVAAHNLMVSGRLTVGSGASLDVIADALPEKRDLQVFGILVIQDGAVLRNTTTLNTSFETGARYIHLQGPLGFIPYATWHPNSTFEIAGFRNQGYINIAHSDSWKQNFGHVIYNCTQQTTAFVDLNGYLRNIAGNFIVQSVNNNALRLSTTQSPLISIGGDFIIDGPSKVWLSTNPVNATVNVQGSFRYRSTSTGISYLTTKGTIIITVRGELEVNSPGRIHMASTSTDSTGVRQATLNLSGNFTLNNGFIVGPPGPGAGKITFSGTGVQLVRTPSARGNFLGNIDYTIETNATANLGNSVLTNTTGSLLVRGQLQVGSPDPAGAIQLVDAGNIQVQGQRTYQDGATIDYNGVAGQTIGIGHPDNANVNLRCTNSTGISVLKSIVINNLEVLGTVNTSTHTVTAHGDITVHTGALLATQTLHLRGGRPQQILANGLSIQDLTIDKTANAVNLLAPVEVSREVTIQSINTTLFSNGNLVLLSTSDEANYTAGVGLLPAGSGISRDVTFQRHMVGKGRIYRFISSPIRNASIAALQDDFPVTGQFLDPSTGSGIVSKNPSLYFYDETIGGLQEGWRPYPTAGLAISNFLPAGRGYAAFMLRKSSATWDVTGELNQGSMNLSVTFTPRGELSNGWNLVGNPYASAIQWNDRSDAWMMHNISSVIAAYDAKKLDGIYRYWDMDDNYQDIPEGKIALGQSFWVRATGVDPELIIHEGAKVAGGATFYRKAAEAIASFSVSLSRDSATDVAYYKIRQGSNAYLDKWDGLKLDNDNFDIAFVSADHKSLAIQATNTLPCDTILPIRLKDLKAGLYHLRIDPKHAFSRYEFIVVDKLTGTNALLKPGDRFPLQVSDNPSSSSSDRISLRLTERPPSNELIVQGTAVACTSQVVQLQLKNVEAHVKYTLWKEATILAEVNPPLSSDFIVQIHGKTLSPGEHEIRIQASSGCQITDIELPYHIAVVEDPTVLSDSVSACFNEPVVLTALSNRDDATFYWFDDRLEAGDTLAVGSQLTTPLLQKSKTYFASAVTPEGCVSERQPISAYIPTLRPVKIELQGDTLLISNYAHHNTWYFNGHVDRKDRYFSLKGAGSYILQVDTLGCVLRDTLETVVTRIPIEIDEGVAIHPNPTSGKIYIWDRDKSVKRMEVFDGNGALMLQQDGESIAYDYCLDLQAISPGLYTLRLLTSSGKKIFKILKVR